MKVDSKNTNDEKKYSLLLQVKNVANISKILYITKFIGSYFKFIFYNIKTKESIMTDGF